MAKVRSAKTSDVAAIESLLLASQLLPEGIKDHIANFLVAEEEGKIIGVGGFENCGGGVGLLRSIAVLQERQNQGIAAQLYEQVAAHACHSGVSGLYLLTTTAQGYFAKLGFECIERAKAPESIRNTNQFRDLCPDTAVLMFRTVVPEGNGGATGSMPSPAASPENDMY